MKKIIFLLIIFVLLALPLGYVSAQLPNLEIIYPRIPGDQTPPTVISEGLPDYVNYIYYFFFAIIGIIVLGALIYNGIIYLTSVGSPDKLMSAKKGIVAAFLGAIILFSSWFVFQNINPQITVLEAEDPDLIEPVITPGIYLCNYSIGNINELLRNYLESENLNQRIEAARAIKGLIKNGDNICFRVTFSGNISFDFKPRNHAIFQIPKIIYPDNPEEDIKYWYMYGIIFHQKDNFRGKCAIGKLYRLNDFNTGVADQNNYFTRTGYVERIRSVTLFEAPTNPFYGGVILYQCLYYNENALCPEGLTGSPDVEVFPKFTPADDAIWVNQNELGNLASNNDGEDNFNGTRSIQIDREGSYFAILFSEDNYKGKTCEVIAEDDNNFLDQPIGQCEIAWDARTCKGLSWFEEKNYLRDCKPCTNSMIVVKGNVVK